MFDSTHLTSRKMSSGINLSWMIYMLIQFPVFFACFYFSDSIYGICTSPQNCQLSVYPLHTHTHASLIENPPSTLRLSRWFLIASEGSISRQLRLNWRVCFPAYFKHLQLPLFASCAHYLHSPRRASVLLHAAKQIFSALGLR